MKFINKYIALVAVFAMMFTSCSKDESSEVVDDAELQAVEITFGASLNDLVDRAAQSMSKDHFNTIPDCSDAEPAVARIDFSYGGSSYQTDVAILKDANGYFTDYSEDLKILVPNNGQVTISLDGFMVYDGDPDNTGNLIWVAPKESDGDFDGYVDQALPFDFTVEDGTKPYIDVEVLCFDRRMVNEYGYVFFDILPEVIYPLCLFVNYCDEDGRHYVADYSIDLYFGEDASGIQLYDHTESSAMASTGDYGDGQYYADPLCLVVPGPPANLGDNEPYLYMVLYPQDWDGTGDIDNSPIQGITLSWNMVKSLLNGDGTTNEYYHLLIGECEGALTGDGSGGNGGGTGDTDLDNDGVDNDVDQCPNTPAGATVNAVGCPDSDGDGVYDNDDLCEETPTGTTVDEDGCPVDTCSIGSADQGCSKYYLSGIDGFVEITTPTGDLPDPYGLIPIGGTFEDRIGTITIQLSENLDPVVTIILNEGFSADDYVIEVRDESGSEISCVFETSIAPPTGENPDIFEEFTNTSDYDYSFFVSVETNICSTN